MPDPMEQAETPDEQVPIEERGRMLPTPQGWKILCAVPEVKDTYDNSAIIKAESFMKQEEHATTVLFVVSIGPDAYKDEKKFPSGAWCKPGDFVLVRTYSGTRVKIHGKEFRTINDDQVECTVADPRGISRA